MLIQGGVLLFLIIKCIICNKCASSPGAGEEQKQDQNTHERQGMEEMGKQENKCLWKSFYISFENVLTHFPPYLCGCSLCDCVERESNWLI